MRVLKGESESIVIIVVYSIDTIKFCICLEIIRRNGNAVVNWWTIKRKVLLSLCSDRMVW